MSDYIDVIYWGVTLLLGVFLVVFYDYITKVRKRTTKLNKDLLVDYAKRKIFESAEGCCVAVGDFSSEYKDGVLNIECVGYLGGTVKKIEIACRFNEKVL